jgi:hypothetical protein
MHNVIMYTSLRQSSIIIAARGEPLTGAPGSTWERRQTAWEHLAVVAISLGAPRITVDKSGKKQHPL